MYEIVVTFAGGGVDAIAFDDRAKAEAAAEMIVSASRYPYARIAGSEGICYVRRAGVDCARVRGEKAAPSEQDGTDSPQPESSVSH